MNLFVVYGERKKQDKGKTQEKDKTEDTQSVLNKILKAVEPIESMNEKLDKLSKDFENLKSTVNEHDSEIVKIKTDLKTQSIRSEKCETRINKIENETTVLEQNLMTENKKLKKDMVKLEEYSRRNNLLFHGLEEREGEDCKQSVQLLLAQQLDFKEAAYDMIISKAHRVGPKSKKGSRPIVAQFILSTDVSDILRRRQELTRGDAGVYVKQKVFITRDFPEEILRAQRQLRPVLKVAKKLDKDAHLSRDMLVFKSKAIDLAGCYATQELEVEKIGVIQRQNMIMFHGRFCPFSNFFPASFVIDEKKYNCVEQYFQKKRADYHGKVIESQRIVYSDDPVDMKSIGKSLEKGHWPEVLQHKAMKEALMAKFHQNERLASLLKDTGEMRIIECNKHDSYWGNGRYLFDKDASSGTGQNKLGLLLEEVRSLID